MVLQWKHQQFKRKTGCEGRDDEIPIVEINCALRVIHFLFPNVAPNTAFFVCVMLLTTFDLLDQR